MHLSSVYVVPSVIVAVAGIIIRSKIICMDIFVVFGPAGLNLRF